MRTLLRILLINQLLAALIISALALLIGLRHLPNFWLPTLIFTNGVGSAVGLCFAGLARSEIYTGAGRGFQNLTRAAAVVLGTALGLAASFGVLRLIQPSLRIRLVDVLPLFGFCLLVSGVVTVLNVLFGHLKASIERKAIENQMLREMEAKTRLASLQGKVNPHFLFNTLNTMLNLVHKSPDQVEALILGLSELYRGVLQLPDQGLVPLRVELDLVQRYLEIERVRMGDRLAFTIQCTPEAGQVALPPLLVEPLAENAVKHGIGPRPSGGTVGIRASRQGERLEVVVEDDGEGLGSDTGSGGFGLYSIRERLRMTYGGAASLEVQAMPGQGFRAVLRVPCG